MKIWSMLVLALFSFTHNQSYKVETSCENNEIKARYEDTWYDVELFNLFIKEEADVCSYIKESATIEFDPLIKIENPLKVYLFIDGELLQQTLIDQGLATSKIAQPNYQYQFKDEEEESVVALVDDDKTTGVSYSKYIAYAFIILYLLILFILWRKKRKRTNQESQNAIQSSDQKVED